MAQALRPQGQQLRLQRPHPPVATRLLPALCKGEFQPPPPLDADPARTGGVAVDPDRGGPA